MLDGTRRRRNWNIAFNFFLIFRGFSSYFISLYYQLSEFIVFLISDLGFLLWGKL